MNIPMIETHKLNGTEYLIAGGISEQDIYSAIYERKRFKELGDFLMKVDKIDDNDLADMLSNRYFISTGHINDARIAAMAILFKLREKGIDRGMRIKVESGITMVAFAPMSSAMLMKPDGDMLNPFAVEDNALMFLMDENDYEQDSNSEEFCDERLRFFVFCKPGDSGEEAARMRRLMEDSCISIDVKNDSPEDIRELMESFFYEKDYDIDLVTEEIRVLSFYIPHDTEYSAMQICRKIIGNHLLNAPDSRQLQKEDFAGMIQSLKNSKKFKKLENKIISDHKLIGLDNEMKKIHGVIDLLRLERSRRDMGIESEFEGCSMVFAGPPGTAKTSLARYFARMLESNGFISNADNFKECTKSDIVGQYVGHTADNVDTMFREMDSMGGGVIFFDEIYTLSEKDSTSYDREAVTCITQNMENYRKSVFCIFAGYSNKMEEFLASNPGLRSRIQFTVKFREYSSELLCSIFKTIAAHRHFKVPADCDDILLDYFSRLRTVRGDQFGNGREARNLYSNVVQKLAERVGGKRSLSKKVLTTFTREDISAASEDIIASELGTEAFVPRRIGF